MAKNVDRAVRLLGTAARLVEIEARYALDKDATGHETAKRQLPKAFLDYLTHHI